jgi:hypothetical protein
VTEDGKAKSAQESIGLKLSVAFTVTYTRTPGLAFAVHGLLLGGHGVTELLSSQVQEVDTLGVTGEHEPLAKVNPKAVHTCCWVPVATSETVGLFQ